MFNEWKPTSEQQVFWNNKAELNSHQKAEPPHENVTVPNHINENSKKAM